MELSNLRRTVVAGAAALVVGGSTLGLAYAQQAAPASQPTFGAAGSEQDGPKHQAFIDLVAKKLGVTADKLSTAMKEARTELGITGKGPGHGRGMRGGPVDFGVAAQAIGITPEQLKQELPGKSLAQVAQAHGKTGAIVATALKAAANNRIDQAVTDGKLTAEQATLRKQETATRIDKLVDHVMPPPPAPGARPHWSAHPAPGAQG